MAKKGSTTPRRARRPQPHGRTTPRSLGGPILVAVSEPDVAEGALHVADLLARRDRVNAHALGVAAPLALPATLVLPVDPQMLEDARRQNLLTQVRQTVSRTLGVAAYWSTEAAIGHRATTIAQASKERGSALIIVGVPETSAADHTARLDAVLQIIRAAEVGVLAVPPGTGFLPRRALVAMDFSDASRRAARAALSALGPDSTITLAHVEPSLDFASLGKPGLEAIYERGLHDLFDEVAAELRRAGDVAVDTAFLHGDTATALLTRATEGGYDLIAAGSQGVVPLDRYLVGSVSTALLRGAKSSVLIVAASAA
ncbi:MAG TPA: universal stress protein [Gemmatimonadaceae bacterium]